jgi:hypothetical protein
MKVYLSKPRNHWISPYTIIEKTLFWKKEVSYDNPTVKKWANILNPISQAILYVWDIVHPEINYIKIDNYDTWSMDTTLSPIILPMLKQLNATKHGHFYVEPKDVPEWLRPSRKQINASKKNFEWDELAQPRCEWLFKELIWTFEQLCDDNNDDKFWIEHGEIDWDAGEADERGCKPIIWKKKAKVDWEGLRNHHERIRNGTRLFGIYFQSLWD